MSSRTSSRSTLTMVPSTMSPSLKYLIVWSMAARNSSADPMSLIATWVGVRVGASVVLAVKAVGSGHGMRSSDAADLAEALSSTCRGPGRSAGSEGTDLPGNYRPDKSEPSRRSSGPARYETHRPSCTYHFTAHE